MLEKVKCLLCEKKFFIRGEIVPERAEEGEAFPYKCPYCDEGNYASLSLDGLRDLGSGDSSEVRQ